MHRPLPETHPELVILEWPSDGREFRVENKRLSAWNKSTLIFPVITAVYWPWDRPVFTVVFGLLLVVLVYNQLTQVQWESVIVLPTTGLRLETHKGLFGRSLFVSRQFIPLASLTDVIINEGLRRWDVRYYLAALTAGDEAVKIRVAYENLLPRFPVLHEIYLGIHGLLFNEKDTKAREID